MDRTANQIHLDLHGGISGDMFAAAMLDAFPTLLKPCLKSVACLGSDVDISLIRGSNRSISGARFVVTAPDKARVHFPWRRIRSDLQASALPGSVVNIALALFESLAEAEAQIHGIDLEDVSFHEAGAIDSVVDFVVAATLIDLIGKVRWTMGIVPLGRGEVECEHGTLPVPAPATERLLHGFICETDLDFGERVTPTGAAILRFLQPNQAPDKNPRQLLGSGIGLGKRTLQHRPNLLRVMSFSNSEVTGRDRICVLRCEIDDQTGEDLAAALGHLRTQPGVIDVCQWPMIGKKGRMTVAVQILAEIGHAEEVAKEVLLETTTLGVRTQSVERRTVERTLDVVCDTRVKRALRPNGIVSAKAEMDDLQHIRSASQRQSVRRKTEASAIKEGAPWPDLGAKT